MGAHSEPAFVEVPNPQAERSAEAQCLLEGEGLPVYVAAGSGWTSHRLILKAHRYLYVENEAQTGSWPLMADTPCFRLVDLRRISRHSSVGRHILGLNFEEGTLRLRFSYLEQLDVLVE